MSVTWHLTGHEAVTLIRERLSKGDRETWLSNSDGSVLGVTTNGERAMVVLLNDEDDPGAHAIDPLATGRQSGYVLDNGQDDTYANRDTLPLTDALRMVRLILDGDLPPDITWESDG